MEVQFVMLNFFFKLNSLASGIIKSLDWRLYKKVKIKVNFKVKGINKPHISDFSFINSIIGK